MEFQPTSKQENSPFVQLLLLGVYALVGLLVAMFIGFAVAVIFYGTTLFTDISWLSGTDPKFVGALKILLTAQQIGLFLVPALFLAITEGKKPHHFYGFRKLELNTFFLVLLLECYKNTSHLL